MIKTTVIVFDIVLVENLLVQFCLLLFGRASTQGQTYTGLGLSHQGFILLLLQAAVLPRSDAGSDDVSQH